MFRQHHNQLSLRGLCEVLAHFQATGKYGLIDYTPSPSSFSREVVKVL